MEFIIFSSPTILIISLLAVIMVIGAQYGSNAYLKTVLYIIGFLCVVGCTVGALLLGADLRELLAYWLAFTLLGLTSFILPEDKKVETSAKDTKEVATAGEPANAENEVEGVTDEL